MDGPKVLGPAGMEVEELDDLVVTSSALNNIEINHRLAQKGIAVARVAKERGIPAEQVMTIGDNLNDVSMIQWAGVSFAMGNAELELKEYAKYETATNLENGVGEAILRAIRRFVISTTSYSTHLYIERRDRVVSEFLFKNNS